MALSNIGREPRREITESVVGTLAAGGWLFAAFLIARYFDPYYVSQYSPPWWFTVSFVTVVVAIFGPFLLFCFLGLTHWIGEDVCDWLKAIRLDPRPRNRY